MHLKCCIIYRVHSQNLNYKLKIERDNNLKKDVWMHV